MAPISLGIQVTEVQTALLAQGDIRGSASDFARHERTTASGTLVVEQYAIACVNVVRLAVVDDNPVGVQLGDAVGRPGVEGRRFRLGRLHDFAVKLRGRSLVEANVLFEATRADGVKQTKCAETVNVTLSTTKYMSEGSWGSQEHIRRSKLAVYSAISNETLTWLCAPKL